MTGDSTIEQQADLPIGSVWRHRNGNLYTVIGMSNQHSQREEKYPVTVLYRGQNGYCWNRRLSLWHASMTPVSTAQPSEQKADRCTCEYATSANCEAVRKGYAMGGYVTKFCQFCLDQEAAPAPQGEPSDLTKFLFSKEFLEAGNRFGTEGVAKAAWNAAIATQGKAAPLKDHVIAKAVNDLRDVAVQFHDAQQLRDRIAHIIVPLLKVAPVRDGSGPTLDPLHETPAPLRGNEDSALADGADARSEYGAGWIAVTERLPAKYEEVMVWPHPTDYCMTAELQGDFWTYGEYINGHGHEWVKVPKVTHWMPLPAAPSECGDSGRAE